MRQIIYPLFVSLVGLMPVARADTPPPIRVAGIFDLSGGGAIWGRTEQKAFLLACKDFERQNPGYKVQPLIEDSMFQSTQTVTAFQKLTTVDKIKYIVGPTWETAVPMMPLCEAKRVVCLSPSFHGKEFYARSWRYNFTAWFDDRDYSSALVARVNQQKYKQIAIFAAITPYYDALVENFINASLTQPVAVERVMLEERDFRSLIAKAPQGVDAILMLLDNAGQIQAFLKQWRNARKQRPDIYTDDLIAYLDPPEDVKRHGFRYYYSYPVFNDVRLQEFTERYIREFQVAPEGSSGSVAYDETMILLTCVKRNPNSEVVRDCIANTNNYVGYSGTFSFNGQQSVRGRVMGLKEF